jgi:hypothetical protein
MIAIDLGVESVEQALRLVRALGAHRYVAGRMHLVHVFAGAAVPDDASGALADLRAWALATLRDGGPGLDLASRDERLWRRCSDAELVALLDAFWTPGARALAARAAYEELLRAHGLEDGRATEREVFDEASEERLHPLAIDAGWELYRLVELDAERHKGAIAAYGDPLAFESARFDEETAIPAAASLYELPAIGPAELLGAVGDDGVLARPLVVWAQGDDTYLDYVFRGIERAAKLP